MKFIKMNNFDLHNHNEMSHEHKKPLLVLIQFWEEFPKQQQQTFISFSGSITRIKKTKIPIVSVWSVCENEFGGAFYFGK